MDGRKRIETRSWGTEFRGALGIHAGLTVDRGFCEEFGIDPSLLPVGQILGSVQLIDCQIMTPQNLGDFMQCEKQYGLFRVGRFAWHFHAPHYWATPVAIHGWQRLWDWQPTA
jgi:hypothetical protein